jgi:hypothetical protein
VIDKMNCTKADRAKYIEPARQAGFHVIGYYFRSNIEDCKRRNARRPEAQRVPDPGLLGAYGQLELPTRAEGFDNLYYVKIAPDNSFVVEEWCDEPKHDPAGRHADCDAG